MDFEETENRIELTAKPGTFIGRRHADYAEFLGIPFAEAGRFEYAKRIDSYSEPVNATEFGDVCTQSRTYYEHLEVPARLFYHNEFRFEQVYSYSEKCLNLNIYMPLNLNTAFNQSAMSDRSTATDENTAFNQSATSDRSTATDENTAFNPSATSGISTTTDKSTAINENITAGRSVAPDISTVADKKCSINSESITARKCPVIIFIHGGGFNSGGTPESPFSGAAYARRGIVFVSIQYRVGVLGYLTHEEIFRANGRDGNFGLDDQYTAISWVRKHIGEFGGDAENITLMGQSAGAISIQYLSLSKRCEGMFKRAIMMSGGGLFPKFSLPRPAAKTREYWLQFIETAGCENLDELRQLDEKSLFTAVEKIKRQRRDTVYNTMPVLDDYYLTAPIDEMIKTPLPLDYMIGYTNNDMYAFLMAKIGHQFAKANSGYVYFFDIDAPGDDRNAAFHSADLRYVFGTLDGSRRRYTENDYRISEGMIDYLSAFARTGNPNSQSGTTSPHPGSLPEWTKEPGKALRITADGFRMAAPNYLKLFWNTLTKGEPTEKNK